MKTNEAKSKVIAILTKAGYSVKEMVVTIPAVFDAEKAISINDKISEFEFTNSNGDQCVYGIVNVGKVLKLVENEI